MTYIPGSIFPDPADDYEDGPDHDTRDQDGRGWGPDDCPACGAPPGEAHGCSLAERSP